MTTSFTMVYMANGIISLNIYICTLAYLYHSRYDYNERRLHNAG